MGIGIADGAGKYYPESGILWGFLKTKKILMLQYVGVYR
jgi:hypothetical protein